MSLSRSVALTAMLSSVGLICLLANQGCEDRQQVKPDARLVAALREGCPIRTVQALQSLRPVRQEEGHIHQDKASAEYDRQGVGGEDDALLVAIRSIKRHVEAAYEAASGDLGIDAAFPEEELSCYFTLEGDDPASRRAQDQLFGNNARLVVHASTLVLVPSARVAYSEYDTAYLKGLNLPLSVRINRERLKSQDVELTGGSFDVRCEIDIKPPKDALRPSSLSFPFFVGKTVVLSAPVGSRITLGDTPVSITASFETEEWKESTFVVGVAEWNAEYTLEQGNSTVSGRIIDPTTLTLAGINLVALRAQTDWLNGREEWAARLRRWVSNGELTDEVVASLRTNFPGFMTTLEGAPQPTPEDERVSVELAKKGIVGLDAIAGFVSRCMDDWARGEVPDLASALDDRK